MKSRKLLSLAILPLVLLWFVTTQEKGKSEKNNGKQNSKSESKNTNPQKDKYNQNPQKDKDKRDKDFEKYQDKGKTYKDKNDKYKGKEFDLDKRWDDKKWNDDRFNGRMVKLKDNKKRNWVNERIYTGVNWFNEDGVYKSKKPKNNKKVTICHKPDGSNYPTAITVSENALKAHLNHGDSQGNCDDFDRSIYTKNYWEARNGYYNQYYQTTETLSFGEQLLVNAIDVLTKRRSQLDASRSTLTPVQVQKREVVLIDLQNNVYDLQNSLDNGNQRVSSINFIF
jgi:hypothetical protein